MESADEGGFARPGQRVDGHKKRIHPPLVSTPGFRVCKKKQRPIVGRCFETAITKPCIEGFRKAAAVFPTRVRFLRLSAALRGDGIESAA